MDPEMFLSETTDIELQEFLHMKIREFNNDQSPYHRDVRKPGAITPLNLILKDKSGNFIGGLSANTYWDWIEIDDFFVSEEWRGQGIGASVLRTAEGIALKRGCKSCFLTTFEFQARAFYEKQGYQVVGKLEGYPPGSTYYWMRKNLS